MKYLKIYEEFDSKYYDLISEHEFDVLIGVISSNQFVSDPDPDEKWDDFSDEEISKILAYFPNCEYELEKWKGQYKKHLAIFKDKSQLYISIYKINDEWWGVDENQDEFNSSNGEMIDHHKFYKCDQFEGLIHLLNDKKYFT